MDLHDEKVRVVHVELHGAKEVLDSRGGGVTTIDEVLVTSSNHHLSIIIIIGDRDGQSVKNVLLNLEFPLIFDFS